MSTSVKFAAAVPEPYSVTAMTPDPVIVGEPVGGPISAVCQISAPVAGSTIAMDPGVLTPLMVVWLPAMNRCVPSQMAAASHCAEPAGGEPILFRHTGPAARLPCCRA